jgi:hypothetical protein
MACFFDTSALVKSFVTEAGSGEVAALAVESYPVYLGVKSINKDPQSP